MMNEDYLDFTADAFCGMRLIVEGAIVLYEGDASRLYERAQGLPDALTAFNDIGTALYLLLEQVKELEQAQHSSTP